MQYTTFLQVKTAALVLFYQDFKDTFVCNTQLCKSKMEIRCCCFIRISKILLYAIHNFMGKNWDKIGVVLSGFQRYFCMQYTTLEDYIHHRMMLFYQDFKDTFVCNTQLSSSDTVPRSGCFIRISKILLYAIHNIGLVLVCERWVVLSGFQRYFCMQYTTRPWGW